MKKAAVIAMLLACAGGAWWIQRDGVAAAREVSRSVAAPSPAAEMIVAGLGGFRGIASEVVWFRADRLQDEGRYSEMAQLATILTSLEPHTPEVWAYAAWNLAYNISVMMPTAEDRWRWVEAGLKLLRDDGLRLNPASPELHREIAWLFLSKIGGTIDEASSIYTARWKEEVARAGGDWTKLKMNPSLVAFIDREYGRQNWDDPKASALYWAHHGLSQKPMGAARMELRQLIYQTLMLESRADPRFVGATLREMEDTYREYPHPGLLELIGHFRQQHGL